MELEKRSSKGRFLQLFDWNVKSRKKLFSNKSELSENSKQEKENFSDSTISRLHHHQMHEDRYTPSTRENYVSSVNDDEKETRAPSVVARLMGLDSLPISNVPEPCYAPYFDSNSSSESHYSSGIPGFNNEDEIVIFDSMRNKLDGFTKYPVDLMLQKDHSQPIERFQTEVLPPKSAKPISITHHKLLSPIKSPGFIPTMNAAYLMETAAKIIEQSPRSTGTHKLPSFGSSSVPLRIQDLKERMESAQKSSRIHDSYQKAREPNHTKYTKKQPNDKLQGRVEAPDLLRVSATPRNAKSEGLKGKARPVSPASQAKSTVQKRDMLASAGNGSSANQKARNEVKHDYGGRNLHKIQKNTEKKPTLLNKQSDVLRQNNQKQNCASNKDGDGLRPSVSHQKERNSSSAAETSRPTKTVNRVVIITAPTSRKTNSLATDPGKEQPSSTRKRYTKKPQTVGNSLSVESSIVPLSKNERSIECNFEMERHTKWDAADHRNGMDVVSFTFTSPIKMSVPESGKHGQHLEKTRSLLFPNSCENQSCFEPDATGGDALSELLEEKLKELTTRVDTSSPELLSSGSHCSSDDVLTESAPTINSTYDKSAENDKKKTLLDLPRDKFDASSCTELRLKGTWKWQGSEEVEDHSGVRNSEYERELKFQYCSPLSSLEPSYSECSYNSLDSSRSISSQGSKKWAPFEMAEWSSIRNGSQMEADYELADSASSASLETRSITDISSSFSSIVVKEATPWELEYIRCLLVNTNFRLEEFAFAQAHEIIVPSLFEQLENEKPGLNLNVEDYLKLERKVLFDYVGESLELKRVQLFGGSWIHWSKLVTLTQRKDWLAEELYREVLGWTSTEDLMVDELVDKDASTQLGKWVDFEIENFEEGAEIEKVILTDLVDELVDEFFLS